MKGFNLKSKKQILYLSIPSAIWPIAHGPGILIASPPDTIENISFSDTESEFDEVDEVYDSTSDEPKLFTQAVKLFSQGLKSTQGFVRSFRF